MCNDGSLNLFCSTFLRQHRQLRLQQPLPSLRHSAAAGTFARGGARVSMAGWNIYHLYTYLYIYTVYVFIYIYICVCVYLYIYIDMYI